MLAWVSWWSYDIHIFYGVLPPFVLFVSWILLLDLHGLLFLWFVSSRHNIQRVTSEQCHKAQYMSAVWKVSQYVSIWCWKYLFVLSGSDQSESLILCLQISYLSLEICNMIWWTHSYGWFLFLLSSFLHSGKSRYTGILKLFFPILEGIFRKNTICDIYRKLEVSKYIFRRYMFFLIEIKDIFLKLRSETKILFCTREHSCVTKKFLYLRWCIAFMRHAIKSLYLYELYKIK